MDVVAVVLLVFVLLPLVLGALAGQPAAFWIWAALVGYTAFAQYLGDELRPFVVVIVFLGFVGVPAVMAGVALRRRWRHRRAARRRLKMPERP